MDDVRPTIGDLIRVDPRVLLCGDDLYIDENATFIGFNLVHDASEFIERAKNNYAGGGFTKEWYTVCLIVDVIKSCIDDDAVFKMLLLDGRTGMIFDDRVHGYWMPIDADCVDVESTQLSFLHHVSSGHGNRMFLRT